MNIRKSVAPAALALALAPFAALAQATCEPPIDPATPVDTSAPEVADDPHDPVDPNTPVDPRDVRDPVDPAHPWSPPEQGQDPTAGVPPAPIPTGDPAIDTDAVTGDAVRRGAEGEHVTIRSHEPDSVTGEYRIDFDALDVDADGFISREEARVNDELTAEFHVADDDGDGRLSRGELSGWMR